jgi:Uncharacterised BCR, YnfA/UPF0060 family
MDVARSIALFGVAAVAEIGGAYLVWQAIREGQAWWLALLGGAALFAYGFVATCSRTPTSAGSWRRTRRAVRRRQRLRKRFAAGIVPQPRAGTTRQRTVG